MLRSRTFRFLGFACVSYLAIIVIMVMSERWLVYPAPGESRGDWDAERYGAQEVELTAQDGTKLSAWFFERPDASRTILFFHGNGENIATAGPFIRSLSHYLDANVLNLDYRGYGRSEGSPHESGLIDDAHAALNWLCDATDQKPEDIIFMGRSLGGGVALQAAKEHQPRAFILIGTFSSLVDASARLYPWLPVRYLMRNRFDSMSVICDCPSPLFQVHGARDRIVAIDLGRKLFEASPADTKQFVELENRGHNNIGLDDYLGELQEFLEGL